MCRLTPFNALVANGDFAEYVKSRFAISISHSFSPDFAIGAGISPDETAKTLKMLLEECVIGNVLNDREKLIKYALARCGR